MTSQNVRLAVCHLRLSVSDLYFSEPNEGLHCVLCVCCINTEYNSNKTINRNYRQSVPLSENHILQRSKDHLLVPLCGQTHAYKMGLITVISIIIICSSFTGFSCLRLTVTHICDSSYSLWPSTLHQVGWLRRLPLIENRNELIREQMPTDRKIKCKQWTPFLCRASLAEAQPDWPSLHVTRGHQQVDVPLLSQAQLSSCMQVKGC